MNKKLCLAILIILNIVAIKTFAMMNEPVVNINTNMVKVDGYTLSGKSGRSVTVQVKNPVDTNGSYTLQFAQTGLTGEKGYYSFEFKLHLDAVNDYGTYQVKVGGYDNVQAESKDFYYASIGEINTAINDINTLPESEIVSKIDYFCKILHLQLPLLEQIDRSKFATVVNGSVKLKQLKINEIENFKAFLEKSAVVTAYNQGLKDVLVDSNGNFLFADKLSLGTIDTDGVTLNSLFNNLLTIEGKQAVQSALLNKQFSTVQTWRTECLGQILLKSIAYPNVGGIGYISNILTKKNTDAVGLDATKYLTLSNKTVVDSKIARQSFETLSMLADVINVAEPTSPVPVSTGTGSHGGNSNVISVDAKLIQPEKSKSILFSDVSEQHWAYQYIYLLKELGIISGEDGENFNPDSELTREQLIKMLCEIMKIKEVNKSGTFSDVESGSWYEKYVNSAYSAGIVTGVGDGKFGVGLPITRQDICSMVARALFKDAESKDSLYYTDSSEISDYAINAVTILNLNGIIKGFEDGTFRPRDHCTRAEAAKIIYNVRNFVEAK